MITSGEPKRCYWNSNLIAQTFGGEAIYGYIVEVVKEKYARNTIRLYGHGVWLNPEGKFVDVTPNADEIWKYRFFLPIDEKLILNGVATEELRSIVYVGSDESIPLELCCAVGSNKESLKAIQNLPSGDTWSWCHSKLERINSKKDIALAGSVSASGSYYKLGIKAMIPGFNEQLKILTDEGVDLIILEAMSSQADIVQTMIECSMKSNIPVWLSISCVIDDKTKKIMLGYNDTLDSPPEVYENFEKSLNKFSKLHKGPILIAHSDVCLLYTSDAADE